MKQHIIVMGVSGCGKSTVGIGLAEKLQARFYDGDDYHPQTNIDKMSSGTPLNDADRKPWLQKLARVVSQTSGNSVTACSALKKSYRDILRTAGNVTFVYLEGDKQTLLERLTKRSNNSDHFMPSSLLDSQLDTLEDPKGENETIVISIKENIPTIINNVIKQL